MANTEINQLQSADPSLTDVVPYSKGDLQTYKTTWQKIKDLMGIIPPEPPFDIGYISFVGRLAQTGTANLAIIQTAKNDFANPIVFLRSDIGTHQINCADFLTSKNISFHVSGCNTEELTSLSSLVLAFPGTYTLNIFNIVDSVESIQADVEIRLYN